MRFSASLTPRTRVRTARRDDLRLVPGRVSLAAEELERRRRGGAATAGGASAVMPPVKKDPAHGTAEQECRLDLLREPAPLAQVVGRPPVHAMGKKRLAQYSLACTKFRAQKALNDQSRLDIVKK